MNADITIRELTAEDYPEVSQGYLKLHKLHVEGRADIYKDMEQPLSLEEYGSLPKKRNWKSALYIFISSCCRREMQQN